MSLFPKIADRGQFKSLKAINDFGRDISPVWKTLSTLFSLKIEQITFDIL